MVFASSTPACVCVPFLREGSLTFVVFRTAATAAGVGVGVDPASLAPV